MIPPDALRPPRDVDEGAAPLPVRDVGMLRVLEMCALCQARAAVVVDPVTITGKKKVVSRRIKHALSYYTQYQGLVLLSLIHI